MNIWLLCMSNPKKNQINDYPQVVGRISSFESNGYKNYKKKQSPPSSRVRGGVGNDLLNENHILCRLLIHPDLEWIGPGSRLVVVFLSVFLFSAAKSHQKSWTGNGWELAGGFNYIIFIFTPPTWGNVVFNLTNFSNWVDSTATYFHFHRLGGGAPKNRIQ